jgi:hypothetical protein
MRRALIASIWLAGVATASAHHTATNVYDPTKLVTLQGVVAELDWKQPHVIIHLDVKEADGRFMRWDVEAQNPGAVIRHGLQQDDVRPGTMMSSTGCLARDGSRKLYAQTFVLADRTPIANEGCTVVVH